MKNMIKLLIVAATQPEIEPLLSHFDKKRSFDVLITGVGMVPTAYALGNYFTLNQHDLVINLGIAGSFDRSISLGEVVEVVDDDLAELGAEDDQDFIPIEKLGFGKSRYFASATLDQYLEKTALKKTTAITVNTVHGSDASIAKVIKQSAPQLESMEGAAFFYACEKAGVVGLQIRAVSNYVEKRNRDNWKIGLAVKNLNNFAINLINVLANQA
ncbi:futalosine hydrolase [Mucilaginibacter paludis]|uniref:Futalosine hydrolase n=1 Tax=Mucilaginibacter paludis DSM 18603 TaxID=714943 RepID=H1YIP6_9SPHI|nr:futalosine hydrolase [Mucilaginibacter paludis]EHQ27591.1 futalosine nucleosidase [Mucilaginibacter paludis DSM 18603]